MKTIGFTTAFRNVERTLATAKQHGFVVLSHNGVAVAILRPISAEQTAAMQEAALAALQAPPARPARDTAEERRQPLLPAGAIDLGLAAAYEQQVAKEHPDDLSTEDLDARLAALVTGAPSE